MMTPPNRQAANPALTLWLQWIRSCPLVHLSLIGSLRHLMRLHHIAAIGFIGLLAVLVVGCSTMTAEQEADVRKAFGVPPDMPMTDVGEVKLRAGIPKRVRLGAGKDCTITAIQLTNGMAELTLLYEFKNEIMDGVKTVSHSERSRSVFRPEGVPPGWRLCLFPKGQNFVVAMRPIIVP